MNQPLPNDNPTLWVGICTTVGAGIGTAGRTAFYALSPIFTAIAILMLDRGERGPARLRVLQSSFGGKAPPESRIVPKARNREETRRRRPKHRNRGKAGTTRKH